MEGWRVEQGGRGDRSDRRWKEGERYEIKGEEMDFQSFLFVFLFVFVLVFGRGAKGRTGQGDLVFFSSFFLSFVSFPFFHFSPSKGIDDDDDLLMDGWTIL